MALILVEISKTVEGDPWAACTLIIPKYLIKTLRWNNVKMSMVATCSRRLFRCSRAMLCDDSRPKKLDAFPTNFFEKLFGLEQVARGLTCDARNMLPGNNETVSHDKAA